MIYKLALIGPVAACAVIACSSNAVAQDAADQVAEITVTAQKRGERLQEVPIAVSAFSGKALADAGITSATELDKVTPGLTATQGGGLVQPFLRGVGNAVISVGNESSTALYIDGVYYSRLPAVFFELSDVERVEVLKGPQGTLFGRNASGGLIHVITREPGNAWESNVSVGYGNYDSVRFSGFAGGPIAEGVKLSLSGIYKNQGDGFGTNMTTGQDVYRDESFAIRGKLLVDIGDRTTAKIAADYTWGKSDIDPLSPYVGSTTGNPVPPFFAYPDPGFYNSRGNLNNVRRDKGWGSSLTVAHDLDSIQFTSITAYRDDKGHDPDAEGDYTPVEFSHADLRYMNRTFTQEFQIWSAKSDSFDWIVGLYYLWTKGGYVPARISGAAFGGAIIDIFGEQTINSYSTFGQGTYHITPTTNFTVGLRYSIDKVKAIGFTDITIPDVVFIPGAPVMPGKDFKKLTYKASIDHKLAQDIMAYASYSRGYKSGTFNTIPVSTVVARPEVVDAYEIGLKTQFFDRKVRLNLSAFYYDLKNPQVQIVDGPSIEVENADSARIKGIEFEAEAVVARGLTMNAGVAYTHAKYRSYANAVFVDPNPNVDPTLGPVGGDGPAQAGDASGNWMPRTPKITLNAGANYHVDARFGGIDLDVNYYYNDGFFWQPDNRLRQKSYNIVNAGIGFTFPEADYKVRLWGKNLSSDKYYTSALQNTGPAGDVATPGAPRTYGVTLSASF